MALVDLKTDLKSLKYGRDEIGGGNSGQPYIKSDINLGDQIVKKNDDGLIRGGAVGAAKASTNDLLRVGKFLKDAPRGPLFIIKQVGLQLSNPKLESRQFTTNRPTREQGLFTNVGNFIANTANRISNEIGPTRVYNLGVNTALQIPVNAFGIHFNRHGLLPVQDDQTKYLAVVTANNKNGTNRLTNLTTKFALGNVVPSNGFLNTSPTNKGFGVLSGIVKTASRIFGFKNPLPSLDANQTIADYIGGPGSTYGIGRTRIARYDNTANLDLIKEAFQNANFYGGAKRVDSSGKSQPALLEITGSFIPISNNKFSSSLNIKVWGSGSLTKDLNLSLKNRLATTTENLERDKNGYYHVISSIIDTGSLGVSKDYKLNDEELGLPSLSQINQNVVFKNISNPKLKTYQNLKTAINKQIASGSNFSGSIGYNPKIRNEYHINYYNTLGVSTQYKDEVLGGLNNVDPLQPTKAPTQLYAINSKYDNKGVLLTPQQGYEVVREEVDKLKTKSNARDYKFDSKELTSLDRGSETFKYYGDATTDMSGSRNTYRNTQDFQRIDSDILQIVFRIINPFNSGEDQINFSAYINGFKDDFSSTWNEINYAGRAESFYVYDKFKRSVSFNLQIPCFNKKQLYEKHRALGQIASVTAGSYNNNFLGGVLIRLNVGNYLVGEYGILDNISYSIPDQATWDIDAGLAMNLDASFQFKIIPQKLPQYQPGQGFFRYLPDTYPGYIIEKGRTDAEQTAINTAFTSPARFPTNNQ
jgi:hypothetical protein